MKNKIIRTITSILPVEKGRSGECNNCGACCKLPFRCIFLKTAADEKEYCSIYKVRPPNCRKFPRTPDELELVKTECGFSFEEVREKALNNPINKTSKDKA
jgi:Fe-S-cluster containining protein